MDKKLRKAAEKITMPEDMKERIIKACENIDKTNIERTDNDGYTEVVSGTERISRKNNIIRVVSAIAACSVLAAGIGTTGVLLHKNHRSQLAESDVVDSNEQLSSPFGDFTKVDFNLYLFDENYDGFSDETYAKLADFFNSFDWGEEYENAEGREFQQDSLTRYGAINWDDDKGKNSITIETDGFISYKRYILSGETENLSMDLAFTKYYMIDFEAFDKGIKEIIGNDGSESAAEAGISPFGDFTAFDFELQNGTVMINKNNGRSYELVADMLNRWDWGEETEAQPGREDPFAVTDSEYEISWEIDHDVYWLKIAEDGYVIYSGDRYDEDYLNYLNSEEICRKYYNIEVNSFDEGIYECISEAEYITQEEIDYLTSGELISAELYDISEGKNENITPTSEGDKQYVEEFLSGMFIDMLKDNIIPESQEDLRYSAVLMYKDNDKTIRRTYYVHENGCVVLYEYEVTPAGEEPITTASYSVDFNEFEPFLGKFGVNIEK
ncbi:MAG: hypothetical protein IKH96_03125 [Ruminococcus sp.]|uniref:hypothetical protein n=1 Tax=Ruminococcus sp. TaxID=41978 RepID=UPI0025D92657|nr:hypothetical protein [Ruminococcus sp.]MBR6994991.1 hypothetical protein [Ruminococcus sp.]